jgi:hypothetical protein
MIEEERYCQTCHHRCHCYAPTCKVEIGVGMTDKTQPCECPKCDCAGKDAPIWR